MALAKSGATDMTFNLGQRSALSPRGIVSVTTMLLKEEAQSLSIAGPERTAWVAQAMVSRAPDSRSTSAADTMVPAVSIMSSSTMASLPSTSAYHVHGLGFVGLVPALVDDGQPGPKAFGVCPGPFHPPRRPGRR